MNKSGKSGLLYKVLPLVLIMFGACACWAFSHKGPEPTATDREKLLYIVGQLLEKNHFSAKKIDDAFSAEVYDAALKEVDSDKDILLQADAAKLNQYRTKIDDEIHGAPMQFYTALEDAYKKNITTLIADTKELLAKPFDFGTDENVNLDKESKEYPATAKARKELWRKKIKYLILERYADLLEQKKNNPTDTAYAKTDAALEKIARDRVVKIINKNFDRLVKRAEGNEGFNDFVNVIAETMDPHTNYMAPIEKRSFDEDLSGKFYGIGAQLKDDEGAIKIVSVIPGSPAFKSGQVQVNDVIIKVANNNIETDLAGYALEDAIKLIRGSKGTTVKLTFKQPDGTTKVVSLVRDEIIQDEKYARSAIVTQNDKRIGYIFLPEFYADINDANGARCSIDVAKELIKLKREKVDGVIIDLRFNGGGFLYEVVNMVGLFIEDGPVVQVKDKNGNASVLDDKDKTILYDGPVAVMVNELSASASEIFAAAIQDYKRGIVVGSSSTYGKGTVQRPLPVGGPVDYSTGETPYGSLKITQQKFYRVSGGSTQLKGVVPDVIFPDVYETFKIREKDSKLALPWDVIPKAPIKEWDKNSTFGTIEKDALARIDTTRSFQLIKKNTDWLEKNSNKEVSLNLVQYQQKQADIKKIVKETGDVQKLNTDLSITSLLADNDKFVNNVDTAKQQRYQQWLKGLRTDIYIKATAELVAQMAANPAIAVEKIILFHHILYYHFMMAETELMEKRKWYALYTKPRWEKKINALLIKKNITVWCPLQKTVRQWSDRKKTIEEPLFKGYIFVYTNLHEKNKVLQTEGVLNFVHYLGKPAIIRDNEIDTLKAYINNDEVKISLASIAAISKDMRIKIDKGIFMNNTGTVIRINKKTALINLETLGQVMIIEFPVNHIAMV